MEKSEHADMMLQLAHEDLKALKGMKNTRIFSDVIFGFHVQQAVEKSLKAWLSHLENEYPKTHDISLLLNLLASNGEKVDSYWPFVEYNTYAVQSRYELIVENEPLHRTQAIQKVEALLKKVEKAISR